MPHGGVNHDDESWFTSDSDTAESPLNDVHENNMHFSFFPTCMCIIKYCTVPVHLECDITPRVKIRSHSSQMQKPMKYTLPPKHSCHCITVHASFHTWVQWVWLNKLSSHHCPVQYSLNVWGTVPLVLACHLIGIKKMYNNQDICTASQKRNSTIFTEA